MEPVESQRPVLDYHQPRHHVARIPYGLVCGLAVVLAYPTVAMAVAAGVQRLFDLDLVGTLLPYRHTRLEMIYLPWFLFSFMGGLLALPALVIVPIGLRCEVPRRRMIALWIICGIHTTAFALLNLPPLRPKLL